VRAWRVHELGEPRDVLRLEDVPDPEPGRGQLLVRVRAAAANFPDVLLCRGAYQIKPPLPFTTGVELCGQVVAFGDDVAGVLPGERVIGSPLLPTGAFAELTLMDAARTFDAPEALDDAEASALHIGYQTGWFGLHRRARLQPGETLLVHGAAGGVGSAAVQLGKAVGFASGTIPKPALNHALIKNYSIVGLHWGLYHQYDPGAVRQCHDELCKLAESGAVKPLVSERLPLDQAADGLQRLADGDTVGRVAVVPDQEYGRSR